MSDNTLRLHNQTRIFIESPREPSNETLDRYTYSVEQLEEFAARPSDITDLAVAQEVADWLEQGIAGIDAQLDIATATAAIEGARADWYRRAAAARSIKRTRLHRVERRISQLDGTAEAERSSRFAAESAAREAQSAAREAQRAPREAERTARTMANLEAARIAAESRAVRQHETTKRARDRNQMFVDIARDMLGQDQFMEIWRRVDERLEETGIVAQPKAPKGDG
jgi:hypothetical protein